MFLDGDHTTPEHVRARAAASHWIAKTTYNALHTPAAQHFRPALNFTTLLFFKTPALMCYLFQL